MPGPMSAPNGAADTRKPRDPKNRIDTGKIALKKGRIKHIRVREFETTLKDHATREAK